MKITRNQLVKIIQEELSATLGEGEFDSLQTQSQGRAQGEVAGSANTKQIQNLTQRIFAVEKAFKQIGGIEQIVKLTRRVYALEQAAKKSGAGAASAGGGGQQQQMAAEGRKRVKQQTFEEWLTMLAEQAEK